jgi:hypothetical protein
MAFMTIGGGSILVRGGAIATSKACCCNCEVGSLVLFAWYFTLEDKVEVGKESNWYNDVLDAWNLDYPVGGYDLRSLFWVGNPQESPDPEDGKYYYGEFQIWGLAQCCPDRECDDFLYRNELETWTIGWDKIRDISIPQWEWDPFWRYGSCQQEPDVDTDAAVLRVKECVVEGLSFPDDPADGAFVLRKSIEVCPPCGTQL